jgi:hypothetical protein
LGARTGLTGVASGLSGILFPHLTGVPVDRFSYAPVFFMAGLVPMIGAAIPRSTTGTSGTTGTSHPFQRNLAIDDSFHVPVVLNRRTSR